MKRNSGNSLGSRVMKTCDDCTAEPVDGFKKVASLHRSGAAVYFYKHSVSEQCDKMLQMQGSARNPDTFIVHNTSDTEISKNVIVRELNNYKTKCFTCKGIIRRVKSLLEEIRTIQKNEIYAICEHCKRTGVKCKRCEYILDRYKTSKTEERKELFKQWLSKVKQLLETISHGNICQYRTCQDTSDAAELDKLMVEINSPMLAQRQLEIGTFPPMEFQENLAQSKDMLQELIQKLRDESYVRKSAAEELAESSDETACICKYLKERQIEQRKVLVPDENLPKLVEKSDQKEAEEFRAASLKRELYQPKTATTTERSTKEGSTKPVKEKKEKKEKKTKKVLSEESRLMNRLVKERAMFKEKRESVKKDTLEPKMPDFAPLPEIRRLKRSEFVDDFTDSIVECDDEMIRTPKEMITGQTIVSLREHAEAKTVSLQPLLFKVKADCPPSAVKDESQNTFVERGKVLMDKSFFQLNVYKMLPASNENWFTRNRYRGTVYYDSGEILAEIDTDGQGKWLYKNGMVALEYYNAEEILIQKRCVIYSHDACIKQSEKQSQTVLACFDYLGNGVVYDCNGKERLKYNQTEGHLIDKKIGPPGFWKWHSLNDPPVLRKVFIDTYENRSGFEIKTKLKTGNSEHMTGQEANDAMLAIELDNFMKAKADKLLQTFKPFQIRMKTFKINNHFSLRVMDQANIYLLYRDGALTLKLNLGMILQNKEIIDSECAELSCVRTPYDRYPARSSSVQKLQNVVAAARRVKQPCDLSFRVEVE